MIKKFYNDFFNKYFYAKDISKIDYIIFFIMGLFCFIFFNHFDLYITLEPAISFLEAIKNGKFSQLYSYGNEISTIFPFHESFTHIALKAIFEIIPSVIGFILNIPVKNTVWNLYFVRAELVFIYILVAYIVYLICININLNKRTSKWVAFAWMTNPMAFYCLFIRGRFDIVILFFLLLAILFYIKKKYYIFCIIMAFTIDAYPTVVISFVPLVLLYEKNFLGIIKNFSIGFSVTLLVNLIFSNDPAYIQKLDIYKSSSTIIFKYGMPITIGTISYFFVAWILLCLYAYIKNPLEKDDFNYVVIYIPLVAYASLFLFSGIVDTYAILPLTPFTTIILFLNRNKNKNFSWYLDIALYLSFLIVSTVANIHHSDQNLLYTGLLPLITGIKIQNQQINPDGIKSMSEMFFSNELALPLAVSIYFASIVGVLIYTFPNFRFKGTKADLSLDKNEYKSNRTILVLVRFLCSILIFIIPAFISFLSYKGNQIIDTSQVEKSYTFDLKDSKQFMQTFISPGDNISELWFYFSSSYNYKYVGAYVDISIIDMTNDKEIFTTSVNLDKIKNEDVLKIATKGLYTEAYKKYGINLVLQNESIHDHLKPATFQINEFMPDKNEQGLIVDGIQTKDQLVFKMFSMPIKVKKSVSFDNDILKEMEMKEGTKYSIDSLNGNAIDISKVNYIPKLEQDNFVYAFKNFRKIKNLVFNGIALDDNENTTLAQAVYIEIDNKLYSSTYGYPRKDVAKANNNANLINCGFSTEIPLNLIGSGYHTAKLVVISRDGSHFYKSEQIEFIIEE